MKGVGTNNGGGRGATSFANVIEFFNIIVTCGGGSGIWSEDGGGGGDGIGSENGRRDGGGGGSECHVL